ncbi:MAG: response regulator [Nitrospirae bacterium]|nr:response regulator [Nitrospirota bacterium]MBI3595188.1 response regulator [Nitrospirota bacterium]
MKKQGLKNILVVDDDQNLLDIIREILDHTYNVYTAPMGYDALRIIHDHAIDLMTIDFLMPEMTGIDFLKEIKKFNDHLPFIIISGHLPEELLKYDLFCQSSGFLPKPFTIQELRDLVANILKK